MVAPGQYEAVAVANDFMRRVVARENIDEKKFRSIYKSTSYPPASFGYVYNLKPELAKKVREAFLTFKWEGTSLEKAYAPANQSKFVEVNYKEHWKAVRDVDEAVEELVKKK